MKNRKQRGWVNAMILGRYIQPWILVKRFRPSRNSLERNERVHKVLNIWRLRLYLSSFLIPCFRGIYKAIVTYVITIGDFSSSPNLPRPTGGR